MIEVRKLRVIKRDDLASILNGPEFIVIEPITPEAFLYVADGEFMSYQEPVEIDEKAVNTLQEWAKSQTIVMREFDEVPAGYYYDIWHDIDGIRPSHATYHANRLGIG